MTLAERAVACKHWRWMPGMLLTNGQRIDGAEAGRPVRYSERPIPWSAIGESIRVEEYRMPPYLPDFTDPATLGCLLALVREIYGSECWVSLDDCGWSVWTRQNDIYDWVDSDKSEAYVLVLALELAP